MLRLPYPARESRPHLLARGRRYPEVPRHGEHADERTAYLAVLAVDLGQDFDRPTRNGEDTYDLPGLETLVSADQDGGFGQFEVPGRAFGGGVESSGVTFRQAGPVDRQSLPFPEGYPSPAGECHGEGTIPCRRYPPTMRTRLSRVDCRRPC